MTDPTLLLQNYDYTVLLSGDHITIKSKKNKKHSPTKEVKKG